MKYKITEKQLKLIENLNLKSRTQEQEKEGLEYFTNKINSGDEVTEMGYNIYEKLPKDIKNKFWVNFLQLWFESDWDSNYEYAQNEPFKVIIKKLLVESLKDENIFLKIADTFYWSDGSNGQISFSNLNHFITDLGYRIFAEYPQIIRDKNLNEFKRKIEHNTSPNPSNFIKERYKDFKYNPDDEFYW
jgi:hypothetical protein